MPPSAAIGRNGRSDAHDAVVAPRLDGSRLPCEESRGEREACLYSGCAWPSLRGGGGAYALLTNGHAPLVPVGGDDGGVPLLALCNSDGICMPQPSAASGRSGRSEAQDAVVAPRLDGASGLPRLDGAVSTSPAHCPLGGRVPGAVPAPSGVCLDFCCCERCAAVLLLVATPLPLLLSGSWMPAPRGVRSGASNDQDAVPYVPPLPPPTTPEELPPGPPAAAALDP
jgi:hypothetical protein